MALYPLWAVLLTCGAALQPISNVSSSAPAANTSPVDANSSLGIASPLLLAGTTTGHRNDSMAIAAAALAHLSHAHSAAQQAVTLTDGSGDVPITTGIAHIHPAVDPIPTPDLGPALLGSPVGAEHPNANTKTNTTTDTRTDTRTDRKTDADTNTDTSSRAFPNVSSSSLAGRDDDASASQSQSQSPQPALLSALSVGRTAGLNSSAGGAAAHQPVGSGQSNSENNDKDKDKGHNNADDNGDSNTKIGNTRQAVTAGKAGLDAQATAVPVAAQPPTTSVPETPSAPPATAKAALRGAASQVSVRHREHRRPRWYAGLGGFLALTVAVSWAALFAYEAQRRVGAFKWLQPLTQQLLQLHQRLRR